MPDFISKLFSSDYMPHGMCYYWDPVVLWLNVISDALIALSYYAISYLLFKFAERRRDITFKWVFLAFGCFILACGTTHVMGAVTVWNPIYGVEGAVKAVTALSSMATFLLLVPLLPELVELPSPSKLKSVNERLAAEIEERRAAEERVRHTNEELEERVTRRTAERHALQDQLLHSQKMEAVGRLAGGVAHDFNNLLTVILGYAELLNEHLEGDGEGLEYTSEIQRAAERASALTNQLLAFSRRQVSLPRLVDLSDVVRQIERMLQRVIGEDVELETRLAGGLPPVKADPTHMDQLILNLAVNSRDAMPLGGSLSIETAVVDLHPEESGHHSVPAGRYVTLAVTDTGIGMDEATRARIFEPFFTTKESGKGTGLGLSIVYGIVKQNAGEITVHSEPSRGTTFTIYLPAVSGQAVPIERVSDLDVPAAGGATILLVEDDEAIRDLTRTMLHRERYTVLEAGGPAEALRVAGAYQGPIHLLLTDVVMPGATGIDLSRELLAIRPEVRVLYMSGYTDTSVVQQGILTADTPFLQKPFTGERLRRKVREVLS